MIARPSQQDSSLLRANDFNCAIFRPICTLFRQATSQRSTDQPTTPSGPESHLNLPCCSVRRTVSPEVAALGSAVYSSTFICLRAPLANSMSRKFSIVFQC